MIIESSAPPKPKLGFPHVTLRQLFCREDQVEALCNVVKSSLAGGGASSHPKEQKPIDTSSPPRSFELEVVDTVCEGPVFDQQTSTNTDNTLEDVLLPNIRLKSHGFIRNLHESIMVATEDFAASDDDLRDHISRRKKSSGECETFSAEWVDQLQAFSPLWPGNTASHTWTSNFSAKSSFDRYDPHITLGAALRSEIDSSDMKVYQGDTSSFLFPLRDISDNSSSAKICVSRMGNCCSCFEVLSLLDIPPA
jgi:hypothetical protein